jgi:hypothetical protein
LEDGLRGFVRSMWDQEVEDDDDEEEAHEDEASRPLDEASNFVPWSDFWAVVAP